MPTYERPGVYSTYEVSSAITGSSGGGVVGIAATAEKGSAGTEYTIGSYAQAVTQFGSGSNMAGLIKLIFLNGAESVRAVPAAVGTSAPTTEQYKAAFAVLNADQEINIVVCDSRAAAVHTAMLSGFAASSESCKYRIGVVEASGSVSELVSAAANINSERIVMAAPVESSGATAIPGSVAACMAGTIASESDPAVPLNGAVLHGLEGLAASYGDSDINTLVRGGITPVESVSGEISVVRGITTRTTTGGAADATWRELTTVLIVDNVIPTIRNSLRSRFTRTKNTLQTRSAIRTQVIIELENKLAAEIIDGYSEVNVAPSGDDPTICEVSFDFTVAHGLNQIQLTANITV